MPQNIAPTDPERLSLKTYAALNAVFWVLCLAQHVAIRLWLGKVLGIDIFFYILAAGFTLVSVFDYVFGLFADTRDEDLAESEPVSR